MSTVSRWIVWCAPPCYQHTNQNLKLFLIAPIQSGNTRRPRTCLKPMHEHWSLLRAQGWWWWYLRCGDGSNNESSPKNDHPCVSILTTNNDSFSQFRVRVTVNFNGTDSNQRAFMEFVVENAMDYANQGVFSYNCCTFMVVDVQGRLGWVYCSMCYQRSHSALLISYIAQSKPHLRESTPQRDCRRRLYGVTAFIYNRATQGAIQHGHRAILSQFLQ